MYLGGRGSGGGDGGKGVSTPCFLSLFSKARLRVMPNGVKVLSKSLVRNGLVPCRVNKVIGDWSIKLI